MLELLEKTYIAYGFPLAFQASSPVSGDSSENVTSKNPAAVPQGGIYEFLFGSPIGFMVLSLAMLYLMVILPQQRTAKKQQNEMASMLKNLKKNDRVVTSSGIHGVVLAASSDVPTVTIRIDDATNAKMTLNREAITTVFKEEAKTSG